MRNAFLIATLALLTPLACSSDKTPTSTKDAPEGGAGSGGGSDVIKPGADGTCPAKAPILDVDHCLEQAPATAQCEQNSKDQSKPGTTVDDSTCGAGCSCTYCANEMFQCAQHPDCIKILVCAQENACTGTTCYTSGACTKLIDHADGDAGISGDSVAMAQLVNACFTKTMIGSMDYAGREGPVCNAGCK
jgi:hypothetical protein